MTDDEQRREHLQYVRDSLGGHVDELTVEPRWVVSNAGVSVTEFMGVELFRDFAAERSGYGSAYEIEMLRSGYAHVFARVYDCSDEDAIRRRIDELRDLSRIPLMPGALPISVRMTEAGKYEVLDGYHRAARLVAEGKNIPVGVMSIDPGWLRLVHETQSWYAGDPHRLYQEIEHPYFQRAPWSVQRASARLRKVRELCGAGAGAGASHFDVGCLTGRFCREFERAGYRSVGCDLNTSFLHVAEQLNDVFDTRVEYRRAVDPVPSVPYDVITCLSVFHTYLAHGEVERVAKLFRSYAARSRVFITDSGAVGEGQLAGSSFSFVPSDYRQWLSRVTGKPVQIVDVGESRPIYVVSR